MDHATPLRRTALTLVCGLSNVGLLAASFLSQVVAPGYHLSVDFTDGQMLFIHTLVFVVPTLTLATLILAAIEWRTRDRNQVIYGLLATSLPVVVMLVTAASVGLLQRLVGARY